MGQVKNIHQHVPFRWFGRYQLIEIWKSDFFSMSESEDASKEIHETVKAIEAEETDSGNE